MIELSGFAVDIFAVDVATTDGASGATINLNALGGSGSIFLDGVSRADLDFTLKSTDFLFS